MKARVILNPTLYVRATACMDPLVELRAIRRMKTSPSLRLAMLILNPIQGVRSQGNTENQGNNACSQNSAELHVKNAISHILIEPQGDNASLGRLEPHIVYAFWRLS